jgi:hypothetical protein
VSDPKPPAGLDAAGRRLWRGVVDRYDLDPHEVELLRQAVHVADACARLQAVVDAEGLLRGDRAHPAAVELRQQRILLGRLVVALRIPADEADDDPAAPRAQRRGTRGFYSIRGGAG